MYLHKTPAIFSRLFPGLTWHMDRGEKHLFLTFDDGPVPEVTSYVLEQLNEFNAMATFFCVGENVQRNPELFSAIVQGGHRIGNHTYNHLRAGQHGLKEYLRNIEACDQAINSTSRNEKKPLFRPPYGRIGPLKIKKIRTSHRIIMWDVLTGDFDRNLHKEKCLQSSIRATGNGSVVVFHDSLKAEEKLRYVLPRFLAYFKQKGYTFKAL